MKKKIILLLFCIALGSGVYPASWLDRYKKGDIVLKADPSYGAKTDWADIFYDGFKKMVVAPDLSVFVSNIRQNTIYKFDKYGTLLKSFSQAGCGPGDVIQPADLSILDGQYLVVREGSETNRRISIFDFECKYVEALKTHDYPSQAIALRDNKIAYVLKKSKADEYESFHVLIGDFRTKKVVPVATFKQKIRRTMFHAGDFEGAVCISSINGGDLLVGYTESPEITIYSSDGKKKYSFKLKIKPLKVTREMKEDVKQMFEDEAKRQPMLRRMMKEMDLTKMFSEYVPFYNLIMVDHDNNILVRENTGFRLTKTLDFQVYSKEGRYCCDSRIRFGEFIPSLGMPISFQKNALYCILETEGEEDTVIRVVKVNVQ